MDETQQLRDRLDRLETLVGVAYQPDGAVRRGLEGAVLQQDVAAMREQVTAVINFLRDNNPAGG